MIGRVELQYCHNIKIFLAIWKIDLCYFADDSTPHTANNTISLSVLMHYLENLLKFLNTVKPFNSRHSK